MLCTATRASLNNLPGCRYLSKLEAVSIRGAWWLQNCFSRGMLHWSLIFLVIAIIAGLLGFTGIAGAAMGLAKILFFVFLAIWLIVFLLVRKAV
jgi:uncharacterized membrane protein YtjA (UPF0391 family)